MARSDKGAVVITGASTGIGRATALLLDREGYRVFPGVRKQDDADSLSEAGSDRLTPVILDVTDESAIAAAKAAVEEAVGERGLAGIVNNAGVGRGGPVEFLSLEDLRYQIEVNFTGQVAVTQAFLPLIRKARGKVFFISSIGGRIASPFMSPYNASKFAIEGLADSLRREISPWGMKVVVIEPGSISTEIWDKAADTATRLTGEMSGEQRRLYGPQLERVTEGLRETADRGIPAEKVAEVILGALRSDNPRTRYLVGADARIAARVNKVVGDRIFDRIIKRRWKLPDPPEGG